MGGQRRLSVLPTDGQQEGACLNGNNAMRQSLDDHEDMTGDQLVNGASDLEAQPAFEALNGDGGLRTQVAASRFLSPLPRQSVLTVLGRPP